MKNSTRSPVASPRGRAFDRHSATGTRGLPKKGGAGKKGVWGAEMDQVPVVFFDKNDPNYDSDEERKMEYVPPPPPALDLDETALKQLHAKEGDEESDAASPVEPVKTAQAEEESK